MRTFFFISFLLIATFSQAQALFPGSFLDYSYRNNNLRNLNTNDSLFNKKKWSITKYSSISTGIIGWKGGYASVLSAPLGLQLNRKITDNTYAFAGVSVAPSYINFRQSFMTTDFNKADANNRFYRAHNFGLYPRAEIGLGYTNDEHTFSISGSIGIERNTYSMPFYVPYNNSINTSNAAFLK